MDYILSTITWKALIEIFILWWFIYHVLLFFEGTRALQVLRGIIVLLVAFLFFQRFEFTVLSWLITKLFGISVIAILVIFHPEIRRGLARLGQRHLFSNTFREEELDVVLDQSSRAADNLCRYKSGALIVLETNDSLTAYIENGVQIDAKVSSELIETIFTRNSLLHDGGLIIRNGRVASAGSIFPLSDNQDLNRIYGTRHRAALGLSEETDAVVFVVSEERNDISLVYRGRMYRDLSREELVRKAKQFMTEPDDA